MTRTAIVTASDSGIGKATAVALAQAGFDVGVTWHHDEAGAQDTAEEVRAAGRRAEVRRLDLEQLPGAVDVVDELADALGGTLWAFVSNAGGGGGGPLLDLPYEEWRTRMRVNLDGAFLGIQRAARRMVDAGAGGRIVAVTSVHEHQPRVGATDYVAAKHGLGGLVKNAALELGQHGITVNAVAPGEIATPLTGNEDVDPATQRRPGVPLGRVGDAREMAAVIAFLCSDAASYITGSSYVADGGHAADGPAGRVAPTARRLARGLTTRPRPAHPAGQPGGRAYRSEWRPCAHAVSSRLANRSARNVLARMPNTTSGGQLGLGGQQRAHHAAPHQLLVHGVGLDVLGVERRRLRGEAHAGASPGPAGPSRARRSARRWRTARRARRAGRGAARTATSG